MFDISLHFITQKIDHCEIPFAGYYEVSISNSDGSLMQQNPDSKSASSTKATQCISSNFDSKNNIKENIYMYVVSNSLLRLLVEVLLGLALGGRGQGEIVLLGGHVLLHTLEHGAGTVEVGVDMALEEGVVGVEVVLGSPSRRPSEPWRLPTRHGTPRPSAW